MLGRSHVVGGWIVGLSAAPLIGLHDIRQVVPFAAATAGWALAPDLDHPGAKASRSLGPITESLSWVIRGISARVYHLTMGPNDEHWSGKHRHLSHTLVFAALLGLLAAWAAKAGGPWAVAGICAAGLLLAVDGLGKASVADWFLLLLLGSGTLWWLSSGSVAVLAGVSGWIGWAVFLGCAAHDWADSFTVSGCPWLWPLPWAGELWYEIKFLGPVGFHTGHWAEKHIAFPVMLLAAVLLIPGVWPVVAPLVAGVLH